jgi:uncharacterized protein YndB with AHSA1/START domain
MERLRFSVLIDAPREKVWHTMLDDETYREWSQEFMPGSHYEGRWQEGTKMLFLAADEEGGEEGGMVSLVKEVRPYEAVIVEHVAILQDGQEDRTSDEARKWVPSLEKYTFTETPEGTLVSIENDAADEYKDSFAEMWPRALARLKELAEK